MHPSSQSVGRPASEIEITPELVRSLLQRQHPDLAGETLRPAGSGWDNAMFRLGERLAVRLPRRSAAERFALNERTWLPLLAPRLPIPVPAPIRLGEPTRDFPWCWSVVPWLPGVPAHVSAPDRDQGQRLAEFFNALHAPAPSGAPTNPFRGVPLATRSDALEERLRRLRTAGLVSDASVDELWAHALEAPLDTQPTWIHGDLHSQNVLVSSGRLSGVIDWGDMCQGDPATDLAAVWLLLPDQHARNEAMSACNGVTEPTWARARGWAVFFAVVLSDSGLAGDAIHANMGANILRRLGEGP